jgi:hypothetical protein
MGTPDGFLQDQDGQDDLFSEEFLEELLKRASQVFDNPDSLIEEIMSVKEKADRSAEEGKAQVMAFVDQPCTPTGDGSCEEHGKFHEIGAPLTSAILSSGLGRTLLNSIGKAQTHEAIEMIYVSLAAAAWVGYNTACEEMTEEATLPDGPNLDGLDLDPSSDSV